MKNNILKQAAVLLCAVMVACAIFPVCAFAAEDNEAKLTIPVEKVLTGNKPFWDETFTFQLKALNNAPMPEDAVDGVSTITITGAGEGVFPEITYTDARTYQYEVSEIKGSNRRYTYDSKVYTITVQTVYEERENGAQQLVANLFPYVDGQDSKPDKISFSNKYTSPDNDGGGGEVPRTGTDTPYGLLWTLFGICCAGLIVHIYRSKKNDGSGKKAE